MKGLILSKTCLWDVFFKNLRNSLLSNIYLYISIVVPLKAKYRCCIFLLLHKLFFFISGDRNIIDNYFFGRKGRV